MGGQEQDFELGEDTRIRLGVGVRVFAALCTMALSGAGALWYERAERYDSYAELKKEIEEAEQHIKTAVLEADSKAGARVQDALQAVDRTYVKEESSQYRAAQLSSGLQNAIDKLQTELTYLRRDVGNISATVQQIPEISAQLKVLQERKP